MFYYKEISKKIKENFNSKKLKLHEPIFSLQEKKNLAICINSGFVSTSLNGHFIKKLENQIKKYTKCKYVVCTINGVSGLHASLLALDVKKNDEVLVPSLTFVATVNPVLYAGAIPHFVDADIKNFGVDFKKLKAYLELISYKKGAFFYNKKTNRRLKALINVHVFGNPSDIYKLKSLAKRYNLKLIEDATEALGSFFKNKHVGNFGDTGVFSFNGNKIITAGGGGAVITNNKILYEKISHLVSNAKKKHKWEFIHDQTGFNYRMPNINAALVSAQFEKLKKILKIKRDIFNTYKDIVSKFKEVDLLAESKNSKSNYWLNTLMLKDKKGKKDDFIKFFFKEKIFVRPVWKPLHTLIHLKKFPRMNLQVTEYIYKNSINLPSGPGIKK